jgi:hypothetical protein
MVNAVIKKLFSLMRRQDGMALVSVLAMLAIGSLLVIPSINYVSTIVNSGSIAKKEFKAIIAADAGIEDALWKIKNDMPSSFPYSYQITNMNGLAVDVDIDEVDAIAGETFGEPGTHEDRLLVSGNATYNYSTGNYTYTLELNSDHNKPIKIVRILIDFPLGVDYVSGSTSSNVTKPVDMDPTTISGSSATGVTLLWENEGSPLPNIPGYGIEYHIFKLSGQPDIEGMEGRGFVQALSQDIGLIWISDFAPYSIVAMAKNDSGDVEVTIRAGVWGGNGVLASISCWQVLY